MKSSTLILLVGAISLFGAVTNYVPISVSVILFVPFLPFILLASKSLPRALVALLALFAYLIIWLLFYDRAAFTSYDFYRRDGNVFIAFLPLLVFGLFSVALPVEAIVRNFLRLAVIAGLIILPLFYLTGAFGEEHVVSSFGSTGLCHFLFISHNAAGGFYAMAVAFAYGLWRHTRRKRDLFVCLLLLFCLIKTDSRGSFLGLLCGWSLIEIFKERRAKYFIALNVGLTLLGLYWVWPLWQEVKTVANSQYDSASLDGIAERAGTIYDRGLELWPRALEDWMASPIVGIGFGAYNDRPYNLVGIEGVFQVNRPDEIIYQDNHAHHSYLHILAETGLVGFGLTVALLVALRRTIEEAAPDSLKKGLVIALWTLIWTSVTEHRLYTPAMVLPLSIVMGLLISNYRSEQKSLILKENYA